MGRKINYLRESSSFLENILWFNIRRFRFLSFWRVTFFIINLMLFLSTAMVMPMNLLYYIFILVSLSNMLFIYSRINSRVSSYILLRQLGASFVFIIFDNIIEILLVFASCAAFYLLMFPLLRPNDISFMFILYQALVVVLFIPAASLIVLIRLGKQIREE